MALYGSRREGSKRLLNHLTGASRRKEGVRDGFEVRLRTWKTNQLTAVLEQVEAAPDILLTTTTVFLVRWTGDKSEAPQFTRIDQQTEKELPRAAGNDLCPRIKTSCVMEAHKTFKTFRYWFRMLKTVQYHTGVTNVDEYRVQTDAGPTTLTIG